MQEVRITGLGGQGAITTGHILGAAATLYDKKEAVVTEGYSPYITGGWSRADVVVADQPIDYPLVSTLDALVSMYQAGFDTNYEMVRSKGIILVERELVKPTKVKGRKVLAIPAISVADKLGKRVLTNIVLLGALSATTGIVSVEGVQQALAKRFPKAVELNKKAFEKGYKIGKEALTNGEVENLV